MCMTISVCERYNIHGMTSGPTIIITSSNDCKWTFRESGKTISYL